MSTSSNLIKEWLKEALDPKSYKSIVSIIDGQSSKTVNLSNIFKRIKDPPKEITNVNSDNNTSYLEEFITFLIPNESNIFCFFLKFLPNDRMVYIMSSNLKNLSENRINSIIHLLPVCDYTIFLHCQRLQKENYFFQSFVFLFNSICHYSNISDSIKRYFNRSLRYSIQKGIGSSMFKNMLSTLLYNDINTELLDIFFSSFLDSPKLLINYIKNEDIDSLFDSFPSKDNLPSSFLQLLIAIHTFYPLSNDLILHYLEVTPSNLFKYITQITSLEELQRIWNCIFTISVYSDINIIHKALSEFIQQVINYPCLLDECKSLYNWVLVFLSSKINNFNYSITHFSSMILIFMISRINDKFANNISENLGLYEFIKYIFGDEKSFENHFNGLFFILSPSKQYIFHDSLIDFTNFIISFDFSPCNTFCKKIASPILNYLFYFCYNKKGKYINTFIDHFINASNDTDFRKVFFEIFQESYLLKIANLFVENIKKTNSISKDDPIQDKYFRFLTISLACSCNFNAFYYVYSNIAQDIGLVVDFLYQIIKHTPIVDSFIFLSNPFEINDLHLETTTALWLCHSHPITNIGKISIQPINSVKKLRKANQQILIDTIDYTFHIDNNIFRILNNSRIVESLTLNSHIENWFFLTISIKSNSSSIDLSINLNSISIPFPKKCTAKLTINSKNDIQSIISYSPSLNENQIKHIFIKGPNAKAGIIDSVVSFDSFMPNNDNINLRADNFSYFVSQDYISSLYIKFSSFFNRDDDFLNNFESLIEISIIPPYNDLNPRKSSFSINKTQKFDQISKNDIWKFFNFINSLDFIGGVNLIVHIIAEVFVKHKQYQEKILLLLSSLLNRFPLFHYYFVENSIYDMLAFIVNSYLDLQPIFIYDNTIINSKIIQSFLQHITQSNIVVQNLLDSLKDSDHNLKLLHNTNLFNNIVLVISHNNQTKCEINEGLVNFALKLTEKSQFLDHSAFVFKILLSKHFLYCTYNTQAIAFENTFYLLKLLHKLLPNPSIKLELMIPELLVLTNDDVKIEILDILINFLNIQYYDLLSFAIQNMKCDIDKMHKFALICNQTNIVLLFPFFMTNFQLNAAQPQNILFSLCKSFNFNNSSITNDTFYQYLLLFLCKEEAVNNFFLICNKKEITPFVSHIVDFLSVSIENNLIDKCKKFMASLCSISSPHIFDVIFSILGSFIYLKKNIISQMFFGFILNFSIEVLSQITEFSKYCDFFCIQVLKFWNKTQKCDSFAIKELIQNIKKNNYLFSSSLAKQIEISDDILHLNIMNKFRISKGNRSNFAFEKQHIHFPSIPWIIFLLNSIHQQSLIKNEIEADYIQFDTIFDNWKIVFHSLQFPSSHIYDNCPTKYTISESSNKIEVRKILFPMNPSYDKYYLLYWETKYGSKPPEIRLTLKEALNNKMTFIKRVNNSYFYSKAFRLFGISMIKGFLVITDQMIKFYQKNLDNIIIFFFNKIKRIFLASFQHQDKGILIEDNSNRSYLFAFESESYRETFIQICESFKVKINKTFDEEKLRKKKDKWINNKISNFEYLIYLNMVSGRTWSDFTLFPFLPWVIKNYSKPQLDLNDLSIYRDLKYPLFAQTDEQRISCNEYFQTTLEINGTGSYFPNYISNIGSAIYYLVRIEPFTTEELKFQGGVFDVPDRMFLSFDITSEVMIGSNTKSSLEFVPEIYYLPEILKNTNNLVFSQSLITSLDPNKFYLPKWAKSEEDMVYKLKKALESPEVSKQLNKWIDLVWGVRMKGKLANKRCNVYQDLVYNFDPQSYAEEDKVIMKAMIQQIHNCGSAPSQLFFEKHPQKKIIGQYHNKIKLKYIETRKPVLTEIHSLRFDDTWLKISSSIKIRIKLNSIVISKNNNITSFGFNEDIKPVYIAKSGFDVVTAHSTPIIIHWKIGNTDSERNFKTNSESNLKSLLSPSKSSNIGFDHIGNLNYIKTLRGHAAQISSVFITINCSIVLSGHEDGVISVFSISPHCFLRVIKCNDNLPVTMLRMSLPSSNIIAFQKTKNGATKISIFTINGTFLTSTYFNVGIKECSVTSFAYATRKNYIVLLTTQSQIIVLNERTLEIVQMQDCSDLPNILSMQILMNETILLVTETKEIIVCKMYYNL